MFRRVTSVIILCAFLFTTVCPPSVATAQVLNPAVSGIGLPAPGTFVSTTPGFAPAVIKGVNVSAENPFRFDFIINKGDAGLDDTAFKAEATKLAKYFLAALTVPEKEMWVNLSPAEPDRIVPKMFGQTEMGRDLLAQDYMLKQLTASLLSPEGELGKEFWERIYSGIASGVSRNGKDGGQSQNNLTKSGLSASSRDRERNLDFSEFFGKIWIIPDSALVYEHDKGAYVLESHLKVMLEEDYVARLPAGQAGRSLLVAGETRDDVQATSNQQPATDIMRQILLPAIEKEVNEGKTFAQLRQIYNAVILAGWYKQTLKQSLLNEVYADKDKIKGLELPATSNQQPATVDVIYQQYLEAFKTGVYNFIKEDYDPATQSVVNRKYFTGGTELDGAFDNAMVVRGDFAQLPARAQRAVQREAAGVNNDTIVTVNFSDAAMLGVQDMVQNSQGEVGTILQVDASQPKDLRYDISWTNGKRGWSYGADLELIQKAHPTHDSLAMMDSAMTAQVVTMAALGTLLVCGAFGCTTPGHPATVSKPVSQKTPDLSRRPPKTFLSFTPRILESSAQPGSPAYYLQMEVIDHTGFPPYLRMSNTGSLPIDLSGWSMQDQHGGEFTFASVILPPGSQVIFSPQRVRPEKKGYVLTLHGRNGKILAVFTDPAAMLTVQASQPENRDAAMTTNQPVIKILFADAPGGKDKTIQAAEAALRVLRDVYPNAVIQIVPETGVGEKGPAALQAVIEKEKPAIVFVRSATKAFGTKEKAPGFDHKQFIDMAAANGVKAVIRMGAGYDNIDASFSAEKRGFRYAYPWQRGFGRRPDSFLDRGVGSR